MRRVAPYLLFTYLFLLVWPGCGPDGTNSQGSSGAPTDQGSQAQLLDELKQQLSASAGLEAEIELFYEVGSGNFSSDVNPVPKEAVIIFHPDQSWTAYFAQQPDQVYPGRYTAEETDLSGPLTIEIIHDGTSADGSNNRLVLSPSGRFQETSVTGTGEASGSFRIVAE